MLKPYFQSPFSGASRYVNDVVGTFLSDDANFCVLFFFQNKESEKLSETGKMFISMSKENIPPNSQQNCPLGIGYIFASSGFK